MISHDRVIYTLDLINAPSNGKEEKRKLYVVLWEDKDTVVLVAYGFPCVLSALKDMG